MLEEIRVKMMKRIGELRQFSNTWITDISPMALKILQENIDKLMQCNLSWNGERGFEIVDRGCTHTVDIAGASNGRGRRIARGSGPIHSPGTSYQQETTTNIASATKGRGKGKGSVSGGSSIPNISSGRGRGMTQESQTSSASGRGKGRGMPLQRQNYEDNSGGHTRPFKRSRMVGIGLYQAEDGFTTLNPGMPSRKVISIGAKGTKRSEVVTGDISYTPR
ncbi:hypothetical protein FXO38_06815 [Capsicum annuum]|nr:hypothetical protein FXO38_06815 [Capsicum annuum]